MGEPIRKRVQTSKLDKYYQHLSCCSSYTGYVEEDNIRCYISVGYPGIKLGEVLYTVKKGDTLSAIARDNGVTVESLVRLNNIVDADVIDVGQVLVITDNGNNLLPENIQEAVKSTDKLKPNIEKQTPINATVRNESKFDVLVVMLSSFKDTNIQSGDCSNMVRTVKTRVNGVPQPLEFVHDAKASSKYFGIQASISNNFAIDVSASINNKVELGCGIEKNNWYDLRYYAYASIKSDDGVNGTGVMYGVRPIAVLATVATVALCIYAPPIGAELATGLATGMGAVAGAGVIANSHRTND